MSETSPETIELAARRRSAGFCSEALLNPNGKAPAHSRLRSRALKLVEANLESPLTLIAAEMEIHPEFLARLLQEAIDCHGIKAFLKQTKRIDNTRLRELVDEQQERDPQVSHSWVAEKIGAHDGSTVGRALAKAEESAQSQGATKQIKVELAEKIASACGLAPVGIYGEEILPETDLYVGEPADTGSAEQQTREETLGMIACAVQTTLEAASTRIDEELDSPALAGCTWQVGTWSQANPDDHRVVINMARSGFLRVIDIGPHGPRLVEWLYESHGTGERSRDSSAPAPNGYLDSAEGLARDYLDQIFSYLEGRRDDNPWLSTREMTYVEKTVVKPVKPSKTEKDGDPQAAEKQSAAAA